MSVNRTPRGESLGHTASRGGSRSRSPAAAHARRFRQFQVPTLMGPTYADENDVDVNRFTRMYISRCRSIDSERYVPVILNR
jgi:hypothetical protein